MATFASHTAVCRDSLDWEASLGQTVYVQPSVIRWTHGTFQKMFICVRLLVDVARKLKNQLLTHGELPMIQVVKLQGKWYSQNNRRLWCFKEAAISVVKARIGQEDNHFLRRVNTVSDGWTVNFFPPCICKKCSIEFPNRKELRWHACKEVMKTSALDWEDQVSEPPTIFVPKMLIMGRIASGPSAEFAFCLFFSVVSLVLLLLVLLVVLLLPLLLWSCWCCCYGYFCSCWC